MKTPMFTSVGLHGGAIVAGLLLVTFLAGCATVATVTSTVPSAPASSFGRVHGVGIDEGSDAIYIATHEGLFPVSGSIGSLAFSAGATPMLVVADERGIVASSDFGATWRTRVTN